MRKVREQRMEGGGEAGRVGNNKLQNRKRKEGPGFRSGLGMKGREAENTLYIQS